MPNDRNTHERDVRASGLMPGDRKQSISERKEAMLNLMRKEDRAFRHRKIAAVAYLVLAAVLFWLPAWIAVRWPTTTTSPTYQTLGPVAWVASFVLLGAGVASTIALMVRRRPIRDAQILDALYDIEAALQQLTSDQTKH